MKSLLTSNIQGLINEIISVFMNVW